MWIPESRDSTKCPRYEEYRMPICTAAPGDSLVPIDGRPASGTYTDMVPMLRTVFRWPNMLYHAWLGLRVASDPAERTQEIILAVTHNAVEALTHAFRTAASGKRRVGLMVDIPERPRTDYGPGPIQEIRAELRQVA